MQIIKLKQVKNNNIHQATITKYEVLEAFFRTEDENDDNMANQLNQLISNFYEQEQIYKRNITELTFDLDKYENVIEYINKVVSIQNKLV